MSENPTSPDPLEAAIVALTTRIDSMAGEFAIIRSSSTFTQTNPPLPPPLPPPAPPPPMAYPTSTPPLYSPFTTIPAPLPNFNFNHGYTPPSPNQYTSSSNPYTPLASLYSQSQPPPPPSSPSPLPFHSTDTPPPSYSNPYTSASYSSTYNTYPQAPYENTNCWNSSYSSYSSHPYTSSAPDSNSVVAAVEIDANKPKPKPPESWNPILATDQIGVLSPAILVVHETTTTIEQQVAQIEPATFITHEQWSPISTAMRTKGSSNQAPSPLPLQPPDRVSTQPSAAPPPPKPTDPSFSTVPSLSFSKPVSSFTKESPTATKILFTHILAIDPLSETTDRVSTPPPPLPKPPDRTLSTVPLTLCDFIIVTDTTPQQAVPPGEDSLRVPRNHHQPTESHKSLCSLDLQRSLAGPAGPSISHSSPQVPLSPSDSHQPLEAQSQPSHKGAIQVQPFQAIAAHHVCQSEQPSPSDRQGNGYQLSLTAQLFAPFDFLYEKKSPPSESTIHVHHSPPTTALHVSKSALLNSIKLLHTPILSCVWLQLFPVNALEVPRADGSFSFGDVDVMLFKQWDPGKIILWANFYNLEDKVGFDGVWNVRNNTMG